MQDDPNDVVDFSTPEDVLKIVETLENAGRLRSQDRATINAQFNGNAPYTPKEVEEHQIQFNVNKLGGYKVALDANQQVNGALMNKARYFNARCVSGPVEKRDEWSEAFTDAIHVPMKRGKSGKKHLYLMMNRNASLVMTGIGALVWMTPDKWLPRFTSLDDLLIPTDATLDLDDELGHFGVNAYLTPYQLHELTSGDNVPDGWDMELVNQILTSIPKATAFTPEILNRPEEWESLWKQHSGFMNSDAVPKVKITYFFYQVTKTGKWHRKILFRKTEGINVPASDMTKFLFDGRSTPFADNIEEILHVQFGTGNVIAPLKFHSTRGLGTLLYALVEADNRLYCQFMQALFENMMTVLRVTGPATQDRQKMLQLHPYAVLEDGVSYVRPDERTKIEPRLVEMGMAQNRQLISESSSGYVQDVDTGTKREQTLGEAQIKLQSANKIVSGMLSNIYWQEVFYYEEVKRRFLADNPTDPDIKKFQAACRKAQIPDEYMRPECWVIDVEQVFGMGDQTLAVQEVTALMAIVQQLDPTAQMIVRRKYIATITRNPDLAALLVPNTKPESSQGRQMAEDVFATLMLGIPVSLREGIEQQDYVIAMAEMMAAKIAAIQAGPGAMGTPEDIIGLRTVAQDIEKHLQVLAQNEQMKDLVNGMTKQLGKMMNDVKAFAQRQQAAAEAKAKESQQDPAEMAKIQTMQMQAQVKIETQMALAEQKLKQDAEKHAQEMRQAAEKHMQDIGSEATRTATEIAGIKAKTTAEIHATEQRAAATPEKK